MRQGTLVFLPSARFFAIIFVFFVWHVSVVVFFRGSRGGCVFIVLQLGRLDSVSGACDSGHSISACGYGR